jgi:uncharacterized iron-regulated membrane protein
MRYVGEVGGSLAASALFGWLAFGVSGDFGIAFLVAGIVGIVLVGLSVWWERRRVERDPPPSSPRRR